MSAVNIRYVARLLGLLIIFMSLAMTTAMAWSLYEYWYETPIYYQSVHEIRAFAFSMLGGFLVAGLLLLFSRKADPHLGKREALLLVSSSWFIGAAIAALPFWFWAQHHEFLLGQDYAFRSFINCYFEAMSGLTTTGSTVLGEIQKIPKGLLLWRSFTHWMGGLGIVVIFVALLPSFGGGTKKLFAAEATGINKDGISPNVKDTTRVLLYIYLVFTVSQILLMKLVDPSLSWFHAFCHSFATLATGGFSTFNASAGGLSPAVQWVLIAFMLLAGVNFGLYQYMIRHDYRRVYRSPELRLYISIIFCATIAVFWSTYSIAYDLSDGTPAPFGWEQRIRDSLFQVVSIQTTTGYASANFEQWGLLPKAILVGLMFIGGCGGSTGGGIKVIRILSMVKVLYAELEKAFRPNVVRTVRSGRHILNESQRIAVISYVLGILLMIGIGTVGLILCEPTITGTTAVTAAISAINNIGPGLEAVGAIENYGWFSNPSKILLCILMAIGRLEIFAVVVIFMPRFWNHD